MNSRSLVHRLTFALWILSTVSCSLAVILSTALIFKHTDQAARERIRAEEISLSALGLVDIISNNNFASIAPLLSEALQSDVHNEIIRVYEPSGKLIFTNVKSADIAHAKVNRAKVVDKDFYFIHGTSREYLALLRSYRAFDGDILWVEIATPRPLVGTALKASITPFIIMFVSLLLFSLILARFIAGQALRPLTRITSEIDRVNIEDVKLWEPLSTAAGPNDFRPVILKVNELLARIQRAFLRNHQLGQFIAHEVRTPLTIIRGEIETALMGQDLNEEVYKSVLQSTLDEVARIDEIVKTVLRFAAKDRKAQPYKPESFESTTFLKDLLPSLEKILHRPIQLKEIEKDLPLIFVDKELLTLLISNLIRNIDKHTPSATEGVITVSKISNKSVQIEISDNGPGLPENVLQDVNSQDPSPGGSLGLGLSLCKQIAAVNRLGLYFDNRRHGGLCVQILCPTSLDMA